MSSPTTSAGMSRGWEVLGSDLLKGRVADDARSGRFLGPQMKGTTGARRLLLGAIAVIWVSELTVKPVAATVPNLTALTPAWLDSY